MGGVVGLYSKLTPVCILICHTCSQGLPVRRVWLSPVLSIGDSDTRKGEPSRVTSVGAAVRTQSPIVP
jgi:hypothetical protein